MSEKLSERVKDIVNNALACALGSGEVTDLVERVAALEQQLAAKNEELAEADENNNSLSRCLAERGNVIAAKDAEIARLRAALQAVMKHVYCENDYTSREYEDYYAALDLAKAALAETLAAPTTLCGQAERDKRLIESTTDNSSIYYGPHPCPACGYTICKVANEQGGEAFDYPVGPIYPNTNWTIHNCQRSAFKGPHDSEGNCILCAHKAHLGKCRETDCGCEIHELGGDSCRGCDPAAPLTALALPEDDVPDAASETEV